MGKEDEDASTFFSLVGVYVGTNTESREERYVAESLELTPLRVIATQGEQFNTM